MVGRNKLYAIANLYLSLFYAPAFVIMLLHEPLLIVKSAGRQGSWRKIKPGRPECSQS
jgi:hypothetical protein